MLLYGWFHICRFVILGAGYHLVMVKDNTCDVSKVTALVTGHVPSAKLESEISAELSYLLPFDQSKRFADLFSDVEKKKSSLGIQSFGTTATTMEEVFLKWVSDHRKLWKWPRFSSIYHLTKIEVKIDPSYDFQTTQYNATVSFLLIK